MSDGKDISFTGHALAETLDEDLSDLSRALDENLALVAAFGNERDREFLIRR